MVLNENDDEKNDEIPFSLNKIDINPDSVFEIESGSSANNSIITSKIKSKLSGRDSSKDKIWIYEKGKLL